MAVRPRVLVADDHPGMAKAVCRLLSVDCEVVGSVADGSALLEAAERLQPDVVVLDVNLPQYPRTRGVSSDHPSVPGDESHRVHGDERSGRQAAILCGRSIGFHV